MLLDGSHLKAVEQTPVTVTYDHVFFLYTLSKQESPVALEVYFIWPGQGSRILLYCPYFWSIGQAAGLLLMRTAMCVLL